MPRPRTTAPVSVTVGTAIASTRYGIGPACRMPRLSTSVYEAMQAAIDNPNTTPAPEVAPSPRTSTTPTTTASTPAACDTEVPWPRTITPNTSTPSGATPRAIG